MRYERIKMINDDLQEKPVPQEKMTPCCCCSNSTETTVEKAKIDARSIPKVSSELSLSDKIGSWKARWDIGRMKYMVDPGLYRIGDPTDASPVMVSANYKMSFDRLRSSLKGIDSWILVLDTKGINVWCAAGKGTFGTEELIRRIEEAKLSEIVSHKKLIVPQLGATGVSAHLVKASAGFKVKFGPVRTEDIPEYLDNGMKADERMRKVEFKLFDRMVLIPVELVGSIKYLLIIAALFILLSGLNRGGYSAELVFGNSGKALILLVSAYLAGTTLAPMLLPYLPGRSFSVKGFGSASLAIAIMVLLPGAYEYLFSGTLNFAGWVVLSLAISSFLAMNFTGATTFTTISGVKKEMKRFIPVQITGAVLGMLAIIVSQFRI